MASTHLTLQLAKPEFKCNYVSKVVGPCNFSSYSRNISMLIFDAILLKDRYVEDNL